jgi:hypothetical protein
MTEEEMRAKVEAEFKSAQEAEALKFAQVKEALEKQLADKDAVAAKYSELATMFEGIDDMKKAVLDFQSKQKEVVAKEKEYNETILKVKRDEVKLFAESLVKENRILPFQQKMVEELLFNLPKTEAVIEFTQADLYGLKEKMTFEETFRTLLKSNPDMGMLKEFTSQEKVTSDPEVLRGELEKKYMADHKVDYGLAQQEISKIRPDLYGITK